MQHDGLAIFLAQVRQRIIHIGRNHIPQLRLSGGEGLARLLSGALHGQFLAALVAIFALSRISDRKASCLKEPSTEADFG